MAGWQDRCARVDRRLGHRKSESTRGRSHRDGRRRRLKADQAGGACARCGTVEDMLLALIIVAWLIAALVIGAVLLARPPAPPSITEAPPREFELDLELSQ